MSQNRNVRPANSLQISQTVKKLVLSSAVAVTFAAYAVHEHVNSSAANNSTVPDPQLTTKSNPVSAVPSSGPTIPTKSAPQNVNRSVQPAQPKGPTAVPNTAVPQPTNTDVPTQVPPTASNGIKDGTYTGDSADAFYGNVQVAAVIQGGKLSQVQVLDYPQHRRTSVYINQQALPYLQTEAIQAQSARVDIVSGATLTSEAFIQSLQSALNQAKG